MSACNRKWYWVVQSNKASTSGAKMLCTGARNESNLYVDDRIINKIWIQRKTKGEKEGREGKRKRTAEDITKIECLLIYMEIVE